MGHGVHIPAPEAADLPDGHIFTRVPNILFGTAVVALLGAWFTAHDGHQFAFSYLTAFLYALSLCLGSLFFVLIQHAGRAAWSVVVRRTAEHLAGVLPWMAILFIPIFLWRHDLYHHWMGAHAHDDPILAGKAAFLNEGFWIQRAALYFIAWAVMGWFLRRKSIQQDLVGGTKATYALERWSYRFIPIFAFTLTFAAFDWAMSLDPHWFSTMWGVYYFAGAVVSGFAIITVITIAQLRTGLVGEYVNIEHIHDLGKLVFAFTIFWTYIAFSQYFLIWYSNIPEETSWFHHRTGNSWETLGVILILCHFVLPFIFLLSRWRKRNWKTLLPAAIWMLCFHYLDLYYMVMPASPEGHHGLSLSVSDILCVIALTGVTIGVALINMRGNKLVPVQDPRLPEALAHVNF